MKARTLLTTLVLATAAITMLPSAQAGGKACNDGVDNDGDGYTDYPADPGCSSKGDNNEANSTPPPAACGDGADNDGDGYTDYPSDPGCSSTSDNDEYNAVPAAECSDGIDNDNDGLADYPADPGCDSTSDTNERAWGRVGTIECFLMGGPYWTNVGYQLSRVEGCVW